MKRGGVCYRGAGAALSNACSGGRGDCPQAAASPGAAARCAQAGGLAERAAQAEAARAAAAAEAAAARRGAAREAAAEQAKLLGALRRVDFLARPALGFIYPTLPYSCKARRGCAAGLVLAAGAILAGRPWRLCSLGAGAVL
jgi:hypothetical protein